VAALLLTLLPGDITYVCVTGLFLAMKVKYSGFQKNCFYFQPRAFLTFQDLWNLDPSISKRGFCDQAKI
jgi:hypothetical protein